MLDYRTLIQNEMRSLEASEREWERVRALRILTKDAELARMLGISEGVLALTFVAVHRSRNEADARHFADMDRLDAWNRNVQSPTRAS